MMISIQQNAFENTMYPVFAILPWPQSLSKPEVGLHVLRQFPSNIPSSAEDVTVTDGAHRSLPQTHV